MPRAIEGRDYYIENGHLVFTEFFLKNRAFCCRNGCRHCPYGYKAEKLIKDDTYPKGGVDVQPKDAGEVPPVQ